MGAGPRHRPRHTQNREGAPRGGEAGQRPLERRVLHDAVLPVEAARVEVLGEGDGLVQEQRRELADRVRHGASDGALADEAVRDAREHQRTACGDGAGGRSTGGGGVDTAPLASPPPPKGLNRGVLNGKKSVPSHSFPKKSLRALHVFNHGWWRLAVGGWRRLAVGSWQLAVGGSWRRLVIGGGWRRLVVGDWWLVVVGNGWRLAVGSPLAVGGGWRLAVGGPLGRSFRAVLNKKKSGSLRTALGLNPPPKKNPTETDPRVPQVTRTRNSAKINQRVEGVQKSHHLPCIC